MLARNKEFLVEGGVSGGHGCEGMGGPRLC